jgi:rubredoxin
MVNTVSVTDARSPVIAADTALKVWQCILCGFVYDEAAGLPSDGIPPGTRWADVPESWLCPDCSAPKSDFEMVEV